MRKSFLILSVLGSMLFTTACNRAEFLFRFADDLAASRVDHYFDLTSEQKKELKVDIRQDIAVGKKEAFPKIAQRLRVLEKEIQKEPVAPETLQKAFSDIEKQVKGLTTYFEKTALKTSEKISTTQVDHFATEVRKNIREEENDPQEATEKAEKRYRRSAEYWVGGISRDQKQMIKNFLVKNPYPWQLQNRSQEFVVRQFLTAAKNPTDKKAFVEKFVKDYESVRLPEYREALALHQEAFYKFMSTDFWNSLSTDQKKRFKQNLIARAEQLERIAQQR